MRLGNIASVVRTVGEGRGITDRDLRREFGNLWVVRLARDRSGWARSAVILGWVGIVVGAAICLYRALRRSSWVLGLGAFARTTEESAKSSVEGI